MEIGKLIKGGAWLTLRPVKKEIGEIRLFVIPAPYDFVYGESQDDIVRSVWGFVTAWNFEADGAPLPCDDETKNKLLKTLSQIEVYEGEGEEKTQFIITSINDFARNVNNFLGN